MYDGFRVAFNEKDGWGDGIVKMYDILAQDYVYGENPNIVIFADNHDGDRLFTKLQEKLDRFKLAMTFLLTTRGVPQIYYGSEILMTGYENRGHGDIRKDFPGGWEGDARDAFTQAGRTNDENEAFNHIRTLLNFRKGKTALHDGQLKHFIPVEGVYVYFRFDNAGTVMVIINNSDQERSFNQKRYAEMLKGISSGKDIITGKAVDFSSLKIAAKTSMVVELK
jgi:glycosidase